MAAGFSALTLDLHGLDESGGTRSDCKRMRKDVDTAVEFLMSWARVDDQVIGLAGAIARFATSIANPLMCQLLLRHT